MRKNTPVKQKVIGYYDSDGFMYCLKHGSSGMESITEKSGEHGQCSVCSQFVDGRVND